MTTTQKQKLQMAIEEALVCVEKEIKELQDLTKPIKPECALGSLARFELMNDQDIYEKTLQENLLRHKKLLLAESKVNKEDFGLCIECDEEINFERLLLIPESTHCMECLQS